MTTTAPAHTHLAGPATDPASATRARASLAAVAGATVVLHLLGGHPAFDVGWGDLGGWATTTPPIDAVVAAVRIAALGLAWYALAGTVIHAATRGRATRRLLPRAYRRIVDQALGATLTIGIASAGVLGPTSALATEGPPPVTVVTEDVPLFPPGIRPPAPLDAVTAPPGVEVTGDPPGTAADVSPAGSHRVVVGEHFWAIAVAHLRTTSGTEPAPLEIDAYWRRLVAANRASVPSGDPDLIHPGETYVLPPSTGEPGTR